MPRVTLVHVADRRQLYCRGCGLDFQPGDTITRETGMPMHAFCVQPVTITSASDPLAIDCPVCLVAAGTRCVGVLRLNGSRRRRTTSHLARYRTG